MGAALLTKRRPEVVSGALMSRFVNLTALSELTRFATIARFACGKHLSHTAAAWGGGLQGFFDQVLGSDGCPTFVIGLSMRSRFVTEDTGLIMKRWPDLNQRRLQGANHPAILSNPSDKPSILVGCLLFF